MTDFHSKLILILFWFSINYFSLKTVIAQYWFRTVAIHKTESMPPKKLSLLEWIIVWVSNTHFMQAKLGFIYFVLSITQIAVWSLSSKHVNFAGRRIYSINASCLEIQSNKLTIIDR